MRNNTKPPTITIIATITPITIFKPRLDLRAGGVGSLGIWSSVGGV